MIPRIVNIPKLNSFFLLGPRGTGKSSFIRSEFPESHVIDLLNEATYRRLLNRPETLMSEVPKAKRKLPIIIDEVQRVPSILNEVHRKIEDEKLTFILTGSSARKLKREGANLLAGRAHRIEMNPFSASIELKEKFSLKTALVTGLLPLAYLKPKDSKAFLETYVATYLKEEIQQEGLVRKIDSFSRFLETASFSQGQVLNISNVASESQIGRKAAEGYFEILSDLLIAHFLPVFSKRAKRTLIKHEKFYFFDVGVFRTIRPRGPLDSDSEILGQLVETLVFQELRAVNSALELGYQLYFWRTQKGEEVDFVLYGENGLIAIEVKSSARLRSEDLRGLELFGEDYPEAKRIVVAPFKERTFRNDIEFIPTEVFFEELPKLLNRPSKKNRG